MPRLPSLAPQGVKNLWIRTALFEKVLDKIVLYLVENSGYVDTLLSPLHYKNMELLELHVL